MLWRWEDESGGGDSFFIVNKSCLIATSPRLLKHVPEGLDLKTSDCNRSARYSKGLWRRARFEETQYIFSSLRGLARNIFQPNLRCYTPSFVRGRVAAFGYCIAVVFGVSKAA